MAKFVYKINKYVNGIDYDKDRDYSAEMNAAKEKGDTDLLAELEDKRNKKIDGENLPYRKTYNYVDIGTKIEDGIRNRISPAEMKELVDARRDKAYQNGQYDIYKSDEIQKRGLKYYYDAESGAGYIHENRPQEKNSYDAQIKSLLNKVTNAREFEYDLDSDPVYADLKNQIRNESRRAATDVLAEVQQQSGGMSSYAATAAAQAANNYNAKLAEQIPHLYELAYQRYTGGLENQRSALDYTLKASNAEHERYQDSLEQFNRDREYADKRYDSAVGQYMEEDKRKFDAEMELAEFDYKKEKDKADAAQKKQDSARDLVLHYEKGGVSAAPELLAEAGMTNYSTMNQESSSIYRKNLDLEAIAKQRSIDKADADIAKTYNDISTSNQKLALDSAKFAYKQAQDNSKTSPKSSNKSSERSGRGEYDFYVDLSKYRTIPQFAKSNNILNSYSDTHIIIDGQQYTWDELKNGQSLNEFVYVTTKVGSKLYKRENGE